MHTHCLLVVVVQNEVFVFGDTESYLLSKPHTNGEKIIVLESWQKVGLRSQIPRRACVLDSMMRGPQAPSWQRGPPYVAGHRFVFILIKNF